MRPFEVKQRSSSKTKLWLSARRKKRGPRTGKEKKRTEKELECPNRSKTPGIAEHGEEMNNGTTDFEPQSEEMTNGTTDLQPQSEEMTNGTTDLQPQSPHFSGNSTPNSSSAASLEIEVNEHSSEEVLNVISGRRIFNLPHLFQQMAAISHSPFDCSFKDLSFVKETRCGFQSSFLFKCNLCGVKEVFSNEISDSNINRNVVEAVVCSGGGFALLDEFCAHLNMPCMTDKTFSKENMSLGDVLKDIALKSMYEAGLEEKKLAIEKGQVDTDGVPYITVVADASWGKRSYRTSSYNSLSGVACIIGYETKKVLFLGIRNSYCSVD